MSRKRRQDRGPNSAVCSICTASNAKDAASVTIESSSPTAVLQRALLQHATSKPSSLADLVSSLNNYFANSRASASKKSNSVPANNEVLSLIWKTLGKGWHDIPSEYNALPCEITIADDEYAGSEANISSSIVKYLCDKCENLLKSYCTFKQSCERILFKILRSSFKPLLLIQTSTFIQSQADDKEVDVKTSKSKSLNLGVKSQSTYPLKKVIPNKFCGKKRGHPRKKEPLPANVEHEPPVMDPSKSICPFCHKQYSIRHSFVHSCLAYRNSLRCPKCNVFSSSYVRFEKHLEMYHQHKKHFFCEVNNCKKRFISEPAFTWHNHFHTLEERSNIDFIGNPVDSNDHSSANSVSEAVHVSNTHHHENTGNNINNNNEEHGNVGSPKHGSESAIQSCEYENVDAAGKEVQYANMSSTAQQLLRSKDPKSSIYLVLSETDSGIAEPQFLVSGDGLILPTSSQWSDVQHDNFVNSNDRDQNEMNLSFGVPDPAIVQSSCPLQFCVGPQGYPESHPSTYQNLLVSSHGQQQPTQVADHSYDSRTLTSPDNILCQGGPKNGAGTLSKEESATLVSLDAVKINAHKLPDCSDMLVNHIYSEHRIGQQKFECPVCDKPFKSIEVLVDHLNKHSNTESCKCLICSVNVKNKNRSCKPKLILSEAVDPNSVRCLLCSIKFNSVNQLLEHNLCVHHNVATQEPILDRSSKPDHIPNNAETCHIPQAPKPTCNIYSLPMSSSQFQLNDSMSGHSSIQNQSMASPLFQNTVNLPVDGAFVPTATGVPPGMAACQYSQASVDLIEAKNLMHISAAEDTLSNAPGYRTSNPVLSYHQNTSSLSYSSDQTALSISGPPTEAECSEDLGRQRLSCDSCGMLFLEPSALASHIHSCQTFGSKLDTPFPDDNFLPATENLSVVNALEGSSGSALTPIERLIGSVDDMDYF